MGRRLDKKEKEYRIKIYGKIAYLINKNNTAYVEYYNDMLEAQKAANVARDESEATIFACINLGVDAGLALAAKCLKERTKPNNKAIYDMVGKWLED